jgi:hypothetical protein
MSTGEPPGRAPGGAGVEDVRADIERTRRQLGETVEALAAKADVKARARQKVNAARQQTTQRVSELRKSASSGIRVTGRQHNRVGGRPGFRVGGRPDNRAALAAGAAAAAFTFIAVVLWRRG